MTSKSTSFCLVDQTSQWIQKLFKKQDFLSSCPSLFEILHYVELSDLKICRLVNKRFSNVIKSSKSHLGRPILGLFCELSSTSDRIQTKLTFKEKIGCRFSADYVFVVTEQQLTFSSVGENSEDNCTDVPPFHLASFPRASRGHDAELTDVLTQLFKKYDFKHIALEKGRSTCHNWAELEASWITLISSTFNRSLAKCQGFYIISFSWLVVARLQTCPDAENIVYRHLWHLGNGNRLFNNETLRRKKFYLILRQDDDCETIIKNIIQKWQSGEIDITRLTVVFEPPVYEGARRQFFAVLKDNFFKLRFNGRELYVKLTRAKDIRILRLQGTLTKTPSNKLRTILSVTN